MARQKGPERAQNMVNVLREWQSIERLSMNDTAEIIEKCENPLIRMIMAIIRHDSLMHHRVQQFLIDTLTHQNVTITREDVAAIWEQIEKHDETEKKTIEIAKQLYAEAWNPVHKQLLAYLITDEEKHDGLLEALNEIKVGMSKASGG
jgi:rubrerythrin